MPQNLQFEDVCGSIRAHDLHLRIILSHIDLLTVSLLRREKKMIGGLFILPPGYCMAIDDTS